MAAVVTRRIGMFGGTFDPPHNGHVAAAQAAIECANLDLLMIVVTLTPPHRPSAEAPSFERLAMCRLAFENVPKVEVSDREVKRGGLSFTVDTLEELKMEHQHDELYLVLGADAAAQMDTWRLPERVMKLAKLIIVTRPGAVDPEIEGALMCEAQTPDVSATEIRRKAAAHEGIDLMCPPSVAAYIERNSLYT